MKGYRTYVIAGLQILFGVLAATDWAGVMSDPKAGMVAIASGVIMGTMRTLTTTPPGRAA